jgi:hypothetical protein
MLPTTSLARLQTTLTKLTPEQGEIIQAKYSGTCFGSMSRDQAETAAKAIIVTAKLITGWSIPTGQSLDLLKSIFAAELQKEYVNLTVQEVELAFRRHSAKIKDYAKDFSLSLFNQVMDHYFMDRNEAVRIESDVYLKDVEAKVKSEEDVKNIARASVEESFEDYKTGKFDPIRSNISASLYDTITGDSLASPDIVSDFIAKGFGAYRSALIAEKQRLRALDAGKSQNRKDEVQYKVRMNEVDTELALLERSLQFTKRYALKFCFDWMKENGKGFYQKEVA